ncbi:MAG TPA: hypothetical protein VJJ98_13705 [Sedimentisphaerales bacterium]|nr:hypothetical protein [Sedimentisphaerales bacterium]
MDAKNLMAKFSAVTKLMEAVNDPKLLQSYMALQADAFELTEQIKEKNELIAQLQQALELKGKFVCKGSAYFLADEDSNSIDGPFCTKCFDVDKIKCRIVACGRVPAAGVQCLKCKVRFESQPASRFLSEQHEG